MPGEGLRRKLTGERLPHLNRYPEDAHVSPHYRRPGPGGSGAH
jgi:hypothetical protein